MGKDQEDISNEAWRRRKARKRVGSTGNNKRKGPEGGANLVFGNVAGGLCAWNRDVEGDSGLK